MRGEKYIGWICRYLHRYKGLDKSLRYVKSDLCVECLKIRNKKNSAHRKIDAEANRKACKKYYEAHKEAAAKYQREYRRRKKSHVGVK